MVGRPWRRTGRCRLVVVDMFVYRDESHVAESCAEVLTPMLRREPRKPGCLADSPGAACSSAWYWLS